MANDPASLARLFRRTDFAWEFLRRNETYRRLALARDLSLSAEAAKPWGLQFLADPDVPAPSAEVFWRHEAAPARVLRLASAGSEGPRRLDILAQATVARRSVDGLHLKLPSGLQLHVAPGEDNEPLCAVLPITGTFSASLRAAGDLELSLRGEPLPSDLTPQQRIRLSRTLVALDAFTGQVTYRDIARGLFGQEAVDRYDWRTSSVRDSVIRLVRKGRSLAAGGYRRLLSCQAPVLEGWFSP